MRNFKTGIYKQVLDKSTDIEPRLSGSYILFFTIVSYTNVPSKLRSLARFYNRWVVNDLEVYFK